MWHFLHLQRKSSVCSLLLQYIVEQTNQYAFECMGVEAFAKWTQVTVEELQAYMYTGFMILMGIVHLPSIYDYWRKDEIYHYTPVASRITRDRFFELHRYLHFADNSSLAPPGSPEYDKLEPIIEKVSLHLHSSNERCCRQGHDTFQREI